MKKNRATHVTSTPHDIPIKTTSTTTDYVVVFGMFKQCEGGCVYTLVELYNVLFLPFHLLLPPSFSLLRATLSFRKIDVQRRYAATLFFLLFGS